MQDVCLFEAGSQVAQSDLKFTVYVRIAELLILWPPLEC